MVTNQLITLSSWLVTQKAHSRESCKSWQQLSFFFFWFCILTTLTFKFTSVQPTHRTNQPTPNCTRIHTHTQKNKKHPMVSFSCESCCDVLVKKKLDQHAARCRGAQYTCLDCSTTFQGTSYRQHTVRPPPFFLHFSRHIGTNSSGGW